MEIKLCIATGEATITRCGHRLTLDTNTAAGRRAFDVALQQALDLVRHRPWAMKPPALQVIERELELA